MPDYHIGTLLPEALKALQSNSNPTTGEKRPVFLQSNAWSKLRLSEKKTVSWDTKIFVFQLEHEAQLLGLPIGQHLMIKVNDPVSKEPIIRSYTPISETNMQGRMELLVKIYHPTTDVPGGKMTMALDQLPLGTEIDCKGPTGRFEYLGNGQVLIGGKKRHVKSFKMICGGTGITPIFQVLRAVMQDSSDPTRCVVLDGNRLEEDILCRDELETYTAQDSEKCTVVHTLTKCSANWKGRQGRISAQLIHEWASPEESSMVLICGPQAMEQSAKDILLTQGWAESDLHIF